MSSISRRFGRVMDRASDEDSPWQYFCFNDDRGGDEALDTTRNLPHIHMDLVLRILAFLPASSVRRVFSDKSGTWAKSIVEGPRFRQLQVVQLLNASNDCSESHVRFTSDSCIIFYDTTSRIDPLVYLPDLQKWLTMDICMVIKILRMEDVWTHYRILDANKQCLLLGLNVNQDIVFGLQVVNPVTKKSFRMIPDIGYVPTFSKVLWCSSAFIRLLVDDNDDFCVIVIATDHSGTDSNQIVACYSSSSNRLLVDDNDDFCVIVIATDHSGTDSNQIVACYSSSSNPWKKIQVESIPATIFAFEWTVQYWKPRILSFATSAEPMLVHNLRIHSDELLDETERQSLKTIHHYVTVVSRNCTFLTGVFESQLCIFYQCFELKPLLPEDFISTDDVDGRFYTLRKLSTAPVDINSYSRWRIVGHDDRIFLFLCNDTNDVEVLLYNISQDIWERQTSLSRHKPNVNFATWKGLRGATFKLL